mmetsp:Transcript_43580/g.137980  ORF Transcript_43580/g.137980 Transcript_43580/m.137980 type:complete len:219 (+) Transcript_43580:420-1076(+)
MSCSSRRRPTQPAAADAAAAKDAISTRRVRETATSCNIGAAPAGYSTRCSHTECCPHDEKHTLTCPASSSVTVMLRTSGISKRSSPALVGFPDLSPVTSFEARARRASASSVNAASCSAAAAKAASVISKGGTPVPELRTPEALASVRFTNSVTTARTAPRAAAREAGSPAAERETSSLHGRRGFEARHLCAKPKGRSLLNSRPAVLSLTILPWAAMY